RPQDVAGMAHFISSHLTAGSGGVAYAVRLADDGALVGTSTLGDVDLGNETVHLGWTAYTPAAWGTAVNPATKLALLTHAFENCGFGRVRFQVDHLNTRSQTAVASSAPSGRASPAGTSDAPTAPGATR
ncbi:GNAT family N-acetyltransferase, partial [Georgenia yuyongxinii]